MDVFGELNNLFQELFWLHFWLSWGCTQRSVSGWNGNGDMNEEYLRLWCTYHLKLGCYLEFFFYIAYNDFTTCKQLYAINILLHFRQLSLLHLEWKPTSWTSGPNISFFSLNAIDPNWPFDSLRTLDALFSCKPWNTNANRLFFFFF